MLRMTWHTFPIRCAAAVTSGYKGTCTVAATHPGCVLVTPLLPSPARAHCDAAIAEPQAEII
jgi:hypothetical protein